MSLCLKWTSFPFLIEFKWGNQSVKLDAAVDTHIGKISLKETWKENTGITEVEETLET